MQDKKARKRWIGWLGLAATPGMVLLGAAGAAQAQAPAGMHLVWSDEFTGAASAAKPNPKVWSYDTGAGGWGNNELETYVSSWANAHMVWDKTGTDNQALQIEAQQGKKGHWYSARIKTEGHVSFGPYGYYEVRCKFPNAGAGYWPAFWLLGSNVGKAGWPACGEIDIAEEVNGQENNHQSLHMPGWNPTVVVAVQNATTAYHTYGVNWQPGYITFYTDGVATAKFTRGGGGTWEFDQQTMFMILNCAIGGNMPGPLSKAIRPNGKFDIDYVREYEPDGKP